MIRKLFWRFLKNASILSWVLKLINIPITLFVAKVTALVVTAATDGDVQKVLSLGTILLSTVIGIKIFNIITESSYQKILSKSKHNCKMELYRGFLSNKLHILYASKHGEILEKFTNDFDTAAGRYTTLYPEFWTSILTAIVYFGVMARQGLALALIFLGISILQIIPPVLVKKYLQVNYEANRKLEAELTDFICSGYRGFATIKLYDLKPWFLEKLKKIHQEYLKVGNKSEATYTLESMLTEFIDKILTYGSYITVGLFLLGKYISLDAGVQAIALAPGFFVAVRTIFAQVSVFAVADTAQKRLEQWFAEDLEQPDLIENESIVFSDVSFSFQDKKILEHVSVEMNSSHITVLKGMNGIGKSTLFRLLTGLYSVDEGMISIGNANVLSLSAGDFPRKLCYLPQDDAVFEFSPEKLYQMILPEQMLKIFSIAKQFGLKEDLLCSSKISELSGGERKKVYLSLAFALEPELLLLDEPTNSLDEEGKRTLKYLLQERLGGAIIITHENCLDDIADEIYFLNNGGLHREEIG